MASMDDIRDLPEGAELSDEMLEGVSGGELNALQEMYLDARIETFKGRGETADDLIAWLQKLGEGHYEVNEVGHWTWVKGTDQEKIDEMVEYVSQHW